MQPSNLFNRLDCYGAFTLCPIEHVDAPFFSDNPPDSVESFSINRDRHKLPFLKYFCGESVQRATCSIPGNLATPCLPPNFQERQNSVRINNDLGLRIVTKDVARQRGYG